MPISPLHRRALRFAGRITLGGSLLVVLAAGGVLAYDRWTLEPSDWRPVPGVTALSGWDPPWAPPATAIACGELPRRWMVIGWDAADWRLVLPLIEAGELPNLAALMRSGTVGELETFRPSVSPAIWTTVATGVSPQHHGITHFYNQKPRLARWWERLTHFGRLERELFSNADRRVRTVWNELSDRGERVLVVGYHNTFPVESVEGMMVSNYLVQDSVSEVMAADPAGGDDQGVALALVHPHEYLDEVLEVQREVTATVPAVLPRFVDLPEDEQTRFLRRAKRLDPEGDQRPYFLVRAYTYDTVVAAVAERFLQQIEPRLLMVHFQSLDWATHQFLYFHRPDWFAAAEWSDETRRDLAAQQSLYAGTVAAFYRYMDERLGRLLALRTPDTAVLLLSDHGVGPGDDPDIPGDHDDAPPGIVVLAGPGIRAGQRIEGATIYDVTPTLVSSLGLPLARNLAGRVLEEAFCATSWATAEHPTVATWEQGEGPYVPRVARPEALDRDLLEQLKSLGYLD